MSVLANPRPATLGVPSTGAAPRTVLSAASLTRGPGLRFLLSVPTAVEALRANKGRSVLTTLGIIIGVAAVIILVALGQGTAAQVNQRLAGLGTNVINVTPGSASTGGAQAGAGTAVTLKAEDAVALRAIPEIARLTPIVSGSAQLIAGNRNWQSRISAVAPDYQQIQNWQIASGSFFTDQDNDAARNVAVIGQTVARNLFPNASPLGQTMRIRNVPFTVIGVLATKGSSFGGDQDDTVMVPFRTGQVRLFGATAINSIAIQVGKAEDMDMVLQRATLLLRDRHRLQPNQVSDFSIRNNNDIIATVSGITQTLTLFLGGVAAVSLIVGGIGIMNIMLVSVTERTREIGIRMAIGARPGDIMAQFLVEAVMLSLLGGLIGIAIGVGVAMGIPLVLTSFTTVVPVNAVMISFGFAAMVGIFFGAYPARKASRLDPIDALRHE